MNSPNSDANQDMVSATELVRNFSEIGRRASVAPVTVTANGKPRYILSDLSYAERRQRNNHQGMSPRERLDAKLSIVLDNISTQVLVLDTEFKVLHMNRASQEHFGVGDQVLRDTHIRDFIPKNMRQFFASTSKRVMQNGVAEIIEMESLIRKGTLLRLEFVRWPDGIACFIEDITEMMAARRREIECDAHDVALASCTGVTAGWINGRGYLEKLDRGSARIFGLDAKDYTPQRFGSFFDREYRAQVDRICNEVLAEGKPNTVEAAILYKGTDAKMVEIALAPSSNPKECDGLAFVLRQMEWPDLASIELRPRRQA